MVSRYRSVAAAITAIFIASACSGATPSSAPASASAPAPRLGQRRAAAERIGRRPGLHRRDGRPADVQRPADRGAAPASRPRFRGAHRRQDQRRGRRFPGDLRQGDPRPVDRHEQLRRVRVQPAVARRLHRAWLPRGPQRARRRAIRSSTGRTSGRSSAISTRRTPARSTRSRSTATSTWSITAAT